MRSFSFKIQVHVDPLVTNMVNGEMAQRLVGKINNLKKKKKKKIYIYIYIYTHTHTHEYKLQT